MVAVFRETNSFPSFELTPEIRAEINEQTTSLLIQITRTGLSETTIAGAQQIISRFSPYFGSRPPPEYQTCFKRLLLHHLITTRGGFNMSDGRVVGYNDFDLEKDLSREEALFWFNREILTRIGQGMKL